MASETLKKVGSNEVVEIPDKAIFKGNFSKVYFGRFDKKDVAVKRVDSDDHKSEELELLRDFQHENIVRYLFTDQDREYHYIVLEKCHCTLREFVNIKKQKIPHLHILWQVINGLAYLHEVKRLIHRDLKPCNILMIFRDNKWIAKITDFEISKTLDPSRTRITQTSIKGTAGYFAPETLKGEKITKKADIFSLGIIFFYVLTEGEHPYGPDNLKIESLIRDGKVSPNLDALLPDFKHDAPALISSMIAYEPSDRPDINEIRAHHIFWDAEKTLSYIQEVSDYCIAEGNFRVMQPILEEKKEQIVDDWRKTLSDVAPVVKEVFEGMKTKKQKNGVCDLLRNIRNLKNHYNEKPAEFHEIVGEMPNGMVKFFIQLFPKLLPYVYETMKCRKNEFCLKKYYQYKGLPGVDVTSVMSQKTHSGAETGNLSTSDNSTELVLRKYQWELAAQALEGKNSLVIAPTGSGKTAVLAGIIQEHIKKNPDDQKHIIFMVPKTALAQQQYDFLERHLPCSVGHIIGEFAPATPPGLKIKENKVTVLTPQILLNELKKTPEESYLTFGDISMLLFDECHSASGNHPYKQVMDLYFDYKDAAETKPDIQIVGVTASPGVGKAKDRAKVRENLTELLANMDITSAPSTVEKNTDELKAYQNEISEFYIRVETETKFGDEVTKVMEAAEEELIKITKEKHVPDLNKIPKDRSKQAYEKWTDDIKQFGKLKTADAEMGRILITFAEHLKMYNVLLQLKDLVPNAMKHTNKMVTMQNEGFENRFLADKNRGLLEMEKNIQVPMLDKLFKILKDEFIKNSNARCIVFVKRKLTARSLEECMSKDENLSAMKPRYLAGTHDSEGSEGIAMTKVDQEMIINAFKDGETKILIATSVAEEGLDIKECNIVIMYNYVTGEVGRIQRRGRGRASDSRAIVITAVGSNHLRIEKDNKICAEASDIAVKDLKRTAPEDLKQKVKEKQRKMTEERKCSINKKGANQNESPSDWEVLCGKCKNYLTTGGRLCHIEDTHVVICDPGFHSRVIRKEIEQKKGFVYGKADFLCNNPKCGLKLALDMVYKNTTYPALSIKKILLRHKNGKLCEPKKKMNMPFNVTRSVDEIDEDASPPDVDESSYDDENLEALHMLQ